MSKRRSIIYRPKTYNLQPKTMLFPDQKEFLREGDGSFTS